MRVRSGLHLCGALILATTGCMEESVSQLDKAVTSYPEIDFSFQPSYLPSNVVVLTFDDAPDWNNTEKVLDVLSDKGVVASFFINTVNWSNVNQDEPMRALVRRIVDDGHELANHSVHHHHMATLTEAQIEAEITEVQDTVDSVFGGSGPQMTLFRAPYGEPYQGNDPNVPSPGYLKVAPIVARYAVHIGWSIDSNDWRCSTGSCVFNNVRTALDNGQYGPILLHSVHAQTVAALPQLIDHLRANGYEFWTTEDVVFARYGKHSWELIGADPPGDPGDPPGDPGDPPGDPGDPPGNCGDIPGYQPGVSYGGGDRVSNVGNVYECKPWPYSGWCGAGSAYEPGVGWAWADAWNQIGPCTGM